MTTIAWDGEKLAGDTQINAGGRITGFENKIHKIKGLWVASAGTYSECCAFEEWIRSGQSVEKPIIVDDFDGIVLGPDGMLEYNGNLYAMKVHGRAAWGSGWRDALAAMDFGEDARGAVKYASKTDLYTGGRVQVVSRPGR